MDAKPHILFVHGNWGDDHVWSNLSEQLSAEGYRVSTLRMPFRGSPLVAHQSLADYVSAVRDIAFRIQLREGVAPVLAGHSLGAVVALKAAEAGCGRGLLLIAPSAPSDFPQPMLSRANFLLFGPWLLGSLVRRSFRWPYRPSLSAVKLLFAGWPEAAIKAEYERMHADSGRILSEFLTNSPATRVNLEKIKVPVLCIAANDDPASPPRVVQELARRCRADYHAFPGSHFLLLEPKMAPLLAASIGAFLEIKLSSGLHNQPLPSSTLQQAG